MEINSNWIELNWIEIIFDKARRFCEIIFDNAAGMAAPGTMPGAACGFREAKAVIERETWWETFLNIRSHWIEIIFDKACRFCEIIFDKAAGMAAPGTMPGAVWGFSKAKADQEKRWWKTFLNIRSHWIEISFDKVRRFCKIIFDNAAGMAAPGTMPGAACGFREAKAEIERER